MVQCFGVAIALAVFAVGGAQPLPVPIVESITELLQGSNAGPCPVSIASCSFVFVPVCADPLRYMFLYLHCLWTMARLTLSDIERVACVNWSDDIYSNCTAN